MSIDLRTVLEDKLDEVTPPPGDLDRVRREGTRIRRRRGAARGVGVVAVLGLVAVTVTQVVGTRLERAVDDIVAKDYPSLGQMDFSQGLRAYADPGAEVHLGGRTFDGSDLTYLDTDATATPYGIVFYDDGRPMLLDEDGEVSALVEETVESPAGFHPTAKADSAAPHVAWATLRDGSATITVHDLSSGKDVDSLTVDCGMCEDLVIEALDEGVVFFRDGTGTRSWKLGEEFSYTFSGAETRIVDVRNGTLLHDGPAPTSVGSDRYLMLPAPVDAQLTFDGRYILDWSSVLRPVRSGEEPVRLEVGPRERGALGFWAIDTDGSVLVAALDGTYPNYLVSDCEVPSGACVDVGPLTPTGGDPLFIGVDM